MMNYEDQLDRDLNFALMQRSMHFEGNSAVHESLRRITSQLKSLNIRYAVVGEIAFFSHGLRRFTEHMEILVTPEGLEKLHNELAPFGYTPHAEGSNQLRDAETGVKIKFIVAGQFPGDGKPKPISFPDPASVGMEINGIQFLRVESLVELKLSSGMTGGVTRLKDFADVVE